MTMWITNMGLTFNADPFSYDTALSLCALGSRIIWFDRYGFIHVTRNPSHIHPLAYEYFEEKRS